MTVPFGWDEAQRECGRLAADNVRLRVENARLSRMVSRLTAGRMAKRLTTGQAAAMAGISHDTVGRLFDAGRLSGVRLPSGVRLVDADSMRRLLEFGASGPRKE